MATGTIRYWAAARAAAGVAEDSYDGETLADALAQARALRGEALAKVLDRCSYVVDDAPVGGRAHDSVRLTDGGTVECLPPFAGGSGCDPTAELKRSWATRSTHQAAQGEFAMILSDLTRSTP